MAISNAQHPNCVAVWGTTTVPPTQDKTRQRKKQMATPHHLTYLQPETAVAMQVAHSCLSCGLVQPARCQHYAADSSVGSTATAGRYASLNA
jgi:hypothetical protein